MTEQWLPVPDWPYLVSTLGHIKRKRGKRRVDQTLDSDGFTTVTLQRGRRSRVVYLDSLICAVFKGWYTPEDRRPIHLDGIAWSNWPVNLDWGIPSMTMENGDNTVQSWSVFHKGNLQHGPFTDYPTAVIAAQWQGDVLIGRNRKREIISYRVKYSLGEPPVNPFDKAREYKALAVQHPNQFWSRYLSEAAMLLEALAANQLKPAALSAWTEDTPPKAGDRMIYNGSEYECVATAEARAPRRRLLARSEPAPQAQPAGRRKLAVVG